MQDTTYGDVQERPNFSSRLSEEMASSRLHAGAGTLVVVKGQGPAAELQLGVVILLVASSCSAGITSSESKRGGQRHSAQRVARAAALHVGKARGQEASRGTQGLDLSTL
jgi:hypothetical protein